MEWERLNLNGKLTFNMHNIRNTKIIHLATGNGMVSSQAYLDWALSFGDSFCPVYDADHGTFGRLTLVGDAVSVHRWGDMFTCQVHFSCTYLSNIRELYQDPWIIYPSYVHVSSMIWSIELDVGLGFRKPKALGITCKCAFYECSCHLFINRPNENAFLHQFGSITTPDHTCQKHPLPPLGLVRLESGHGETGERWGQAGRWESGKVEPDGTVGDV